MDDVFQKETFLAIQQFPVAHKRSLINILNKIKNRKKQLELTPWGTNTVTTEWLKKYNFNHLIPLFGNYDCKDMLNLSVEEAITKCGYLQGTRLLYKIHKKKPSKLLYLSINSIGTTFFDFEWKPIICVSPSKEDLVKNMVQQFDLKHEESYYLMAKDLGNYIIINDEYIRNMSDKSMFYVDIQKDESHCNIGYVVAL